jgi:subtilase family serine protease
MRARGRRALRPLVDRLDERCLLSGYTPAQLTAAYGLNEISFTTASGTFKGNGSGETIALIEAYHDPSLSSDLATFDQTYGLPSASLSVINQGGTRTNAGWELEESMDVEWAHAIAPGANLLVVEAVSQARQALLNALNTARHVPGVVAISMSWGFSEVRHEASFNSYFTTPPGHTGITFVAASGDSGASGGVQWPSASPDVLSVGGTSLSIDPDGNYLGERTWFYSGGGLSRFTAEPRYQASAQLSGKRSTPDVAFDGDPNTGVQVYESSGLSGMGSWQIVGGTSLGTPAWAAILAIVDQGRALAGKPSLDGATQALPTIYALRANDFHPIPPLVHRGVGAAAASALLSTGRGSPDGPSLITDLVATTVTTPTSSFARAQKSSGHALAKAHARTEHSHQRAIASPGAHRRD